MKIVATADLHYGYGRRSDREVEELARRMNASAADVLLLVGDIAEFTDERLQACLELFGDFPGEKLMVPGNHDLWRRNGEDTWQLYTERIPRIATAQGFQCLDECPAMIGDVGFVGNIGWYDYAFRSTHLTIPLSYYEKKLFPNVARWNDGVFVRWGMDDREVVRHLVQRLEAHIEAIYDRCRRLVCAVHHLAFEELIPVREDFDGLIARLPLRRMRALSFTRAYLGSPAFGELISRYEKIELFLCGHSHIAKEKEIGKIRCINIGSNYQKKRFVTVEI
ncbi:MAG: hypothetical protein D6812_07030 [Deltaproteobacteria bacterium]|nr:MAG: hypothetical protein D6812_07030 [Deltaproteobacteria bacterium]